MYRIIPGIWSPKKQIPSLQDRNSGYMSLFYRFISLAHSEPNGSGTNERNTSPFTWFCSPVLLSCLLLQPISEVHPSDADFLVWVQLPPSLEERWCSKALLEVVLTGSGNVKVGSTRLGLGNKQQRAMRQRNSRFEVSTRKMDKISTRKKPP